jgi:hypothetical protein
VACIGGMSNACEMLVKIAEGKVHFGDQSVDGRVRLHWMLKRDEVRIQAVVLSRLVHLRLSVCTCVIHIDELPLSSLEAGIASSV